MNIYAYHIIDLAEHKGKKNSKGFGHNSTCCAYKFITFNDKYKKKSFTQGKAIAYWQAEL